jgi:hypothetical protein
LSSAAFLVFCGGMKLLLAIFPAVWLAAAAGAAEVKFDFAGIPVGETPKGFRSARLGEGPLGEWKIVRDVVPAAFPSVTQPTTTRPVLAQVSGDQTDERFPVLLYDREGFEDFAFTTRFKVAGGVAEQMAGVVFRAQDEKNFYVLRANAKEGNVRFYTVIDGKRTEPLGNNVSLATNQWHELKVECKGNRIQCSFDGKSIAQYFTDNTYKNGKVGFWTKSDSISYFADAVVTYTPKEILAQNIVRETLQRYPRLLGLRIYAAPPGQAEPAVVGASDPKDLGAASTKTEKDVLARGVIYHDKGRNDVTVWMPMHDRNGDVVAAAWVKMDTFWGQTEKNVLARALPVVKLMESRIHSLKELLE